MKKNNKKQDSETKKLLKKMSQHIKKDDAKLIRVRIK